MPNFVLQHRDEVIPIAGVGGIEMDKIRNWAGVRNRREWIAAIIAEDPSAIRAALAWHRVRQGQDVKFADVDFIFDDLDVFYADTDGRKVEPVLAVDDDGEPLLVKHVNGRPVRAPGGGWVLDPEGEAVQLNDSAGQPRWRYVDTGEDVPPTPAREP